MQITFTEQDFEKNTKSYKVLKMILEAMGKETENGKDMMPVMEKPQEEPDEEKPKSESKVQKSDEGVRLEPDFTNDKITLEEARAELAKYSKAKSPKEAKELLKSLGADKLTDLSPDCYSKLLAAIKEG